MRTGIKVMWSNRFHAGGGDAGGAVNVVKLARARSCRTSPKLQELDG